MDELVENVGKTRAIAITILDVFEHILEKYNMNIPDEDRTGEESEACIYGMTYANLEDKIYAILCDYIDE